MIIYCLSYAHDIMIWITRSSDLHSDNIITITTEVARSPVFSGSSRISAPISCLPDRSQNLPYLTPRSLAIEINVLETFCSLLIVHSTIFIARQDRFEDTEEEEEESVISLLHIRTSEFYPSHLQIIPAIFLRSLPV